MPDNLKLQLIHTIIVHGDKIFKYVVLALGNKNLSNLTLPVGIKYLCDTLSSLLMRTEIV